MQAYIKEIGHFIANACGGKKKKITDEDLELGWDSETTIAEVIWEKKKKKELKCIIQHLKDTEKLDQPKPFLQSLKQFRHLVELFTDSTETFDLNVIKNRTNGTVSCCMLCEVYT